MLVHKRDETGEGAILRRGSVEGPLPDRDGDATDPESDGQKAEDSAHSGDDSAASGQAGLGVEALGEGRQSASKELERDVEKEVESGVAVEEERAVEAIQISASSLTLQPVNPPATLEAPSMTPGTFMTPNMAPNMTPTAPPEKAPAVFIEIVSERGSVTVDDDRQLNVDELEVAANKVRHTSGIRTRHRHSHVHSHIHSHTHSFSPVISHVQVTDQSVSSFYCPHID